MPRNPGTGVYTQPAPDVVAGTTIESKVYNDFVNDVELDLNTARPIIAGGTGADDAKEARDNLDAEVAMAQVTDYGTQVWESGSFYSLTSATAPPVAGHAFFGTAQVQDANNIVLEARDESDTTFPGRVYVREKKAGTWVNGGAWTVDGSGAFVKKAGDTMTGDLTITKNSPYLLLNRNDAGSAGIFVRNTSGTARWEIQFSDSSFIIGRYNDSGVFVDSPLGINRANGSITFPNLSTFLSGVNSQPIGAANAYYALTNNAGAVQSYYYWSPSDAIVHISNGAFSIDLLSGGGVKLSTGFFGRAGTGGAYNSNVHNFQYTGQVAVWVDSSNLGNITIASDYRVKKDVADLPGTWDAVKALRPIRYTQADFKPEGSQAVFVADDIERWGFIAHELQETLIENAATGVKDDPVNIQSPNPWTVIAALTKALQEAMTRIEALEARQ